MKILLALAIVVILGYLFFAYSSRSPKDVGRASIADESVPGSNGTDADGISADTSAGGDALSASAATTTLWLDGSTAKLSSKYQVQDFTFKFTGYGPGGKQESGTFKSVTVGNISTDANGIPTDGKLTIDTASVSTGKPLLDKHLCSDDFFSCEKYPAITFTYKSAKMSGLTKAMVTGTLAYNGAAKDVSFDVAINPVAMSASADFLLDTTPFKFKYAGVNKDVRIQFGFKIAEVK